MTRRREWTIVGGVIAVAVVALGIGAKLRPQLRSLGASDRAPDFRAIDLRAARPASLGDYRGKVILLNIWATWCQPCRVEMPSMERLHRQFLGTDFRVVAVSIDKADSSVVNAFVKELGLTFEILHDRPGTIEQIFQTTGVPESFVIDQQGVIVKKVIGATEWDAPVTVQLIRHLLDGR